MKLYFIHQNRCISIPNTQFSMFLETIEFTFKKQPTTFNKGYKRDAFHWELQITKTCRTRQTLCALYTNVHLSWNNKSACGFIFAVNWVSMGSSKNMCKCICKSTAAHCLSSAWNVPAIFCCRWRCSCCTVNCCWWCMCA